MRIVWLTLLAALLAACGAGSGGSGASGSGSSAAVNDASQGTVVLQIGSTAPSSTTILYTVEFTLRLPPGVTVAADSATGEVQQGVLRPTDGGAFAGARFQPATAGEPASVRVNIIDMNGFLVGDLAALTCTVAPGTTPTAAGFTFENFVAKDTNTAVIHEVTPRLSLQAQ